MNFTKIDTLSLSFPISYFKSVFSVERFKLARFAFHAKINPLVLIDHFSMNSTFADYTELNHEIYCGLMESFLYDVTGIDFDIDPIMKRGKNFFDHMYTFEGGFVAWGGNNRYKNLMGEWETREERIQIYFDGSFCTTHLKSKVIKKIHKRLICKAGKITRLDVCLDFINGERTIDGALDAYANGEFKLAKSSQDPLARHIKEVSKRGVGDTFYVGKRESGKLIRFYEKGKQLGDCTSPWLRAEVEYNTNNKRVIDPDALIYTDRAFSSAYPYCERILSDIYEEYDSGLLDSEFGLLKVVKREKELISVKVLVKHAQNGYGKLFNYLRGSMTDSEIVFRVMRHGIPSRLDSAY